MLRYQTAKTYVAASGMSWLVVVLRWASSHDATSVEILLRTSIILLRRREILWDVRYVLIEETEKRKSNLDSLIAVGHCDVSSQLSLPPCE